MQKIFLIHNQNNTSNTNSIKTNRNVLKSFASYESHVLYSYESYELSCSLTTGYVTLSILTAAKEDKQALLMKHWESKYSQMKMWPTPQLNYWHLIRVKKRYISCMHHKWDYWNKNSLTLVHFINIYQNSGSRSREQAK